MPVWPLFDCGLFDQCASAALRQLHAPGRPRPRSPPVRAGRPVPGAGQHHQHQLGDDHATTSTGETDATAAPSATADRQPVRHDLPDDLVGPERERGHDHELRLLLCHRRGHRHVLRQCLRRDHGGHGYDDDDGFDRLLRGECRRRHGRRGGHRADADHGHGPRRPELLGDRRSDHLREHHHHHHLFLHVGGLRPHQFGDGLRQ